MATGFDSDDFSPGYIEAVASTKRKTKEDIRFKQLVPQSILENSEGLETLLKAYYDYMNVNEFIYQEEKTFEAVVLDGKATFRIADPENKNNEFFSDESGEDSSLVVVDQSGFITPIQLRPQDIAISNGNELPGSLATSESEIGKTYTVFNLEDFEGQIAKFTTEVVYWVPPGPSYVINTMEEALNINTAGSNFLELMQKEIAASIPRDLSVNKRDLYKNIINFYRIRGASDSIEVFFRLLFNDRVEIERPYDQTLIPSSGNWDPNPALPRGGQYLDNKGFLSDNIKIQDSLRYQKFSYLIKTGRNLIDWEDVYNRLVHPAGFIFFGEILILIELTKKAFGEDPKEVARINRQILSAMPYLQPGVIGLEDLPVLVQAFAALYSPVLYPRIHKSAALSTTLALRDPTVQELIDNPSLPNRGGVISITPVDRGFGYVGTPQVTFTGIPLEGETGVDPTIEVIMDANGSIDDIIVTDPGSGWENLTAVVEGNPLAGSIANVFILNATNKSFRTKPTIVFSEPTATDSEGMPLETNQRAEGEFTLDSEGNISGINIINAGSGYVFDPIATIGSNAYNSARAKDINPILILPLNHQSLDGTLFPNDPQSLKNRSTLNSTKKFDYNRPIRDFSEISIENFTIEDINNYNANSFINQV